MKRDRVDGTKRAYALWFSYILSASRELGSDKTVDLIAKVANRRGRADGAELKEKLGIRGDDLNSTLKVYEKFLSDSGAEVKTLCAEETKAIIKIDCCPIFEGFRSAGMTCDWLTETMCKTLTLPLLQAIVNEVNPSLKIRIRKYRSSPEDFCLEELSS